MPYNLKVSSRYTKSKGHERRIITLKGGIHKGDKAVIKYWSPRAKKTLTKKVKI